MDGDTLLTKIFDALKEKKAKKEKDGPSLKTTIWIESFHGINPLKRVLDEKTNTEKIVYMPDIFVFQEHICEHLSANTSLYTDYLPEGRLLVLQRLYSLKEILEAGEIYKNDGLGPFYDSKLSKMETRLRSGEFSEDSWRNKAYQEWLKLPIHNNKKE